MVLNSGLMKHFLSTILFFLSVSLFSFNKTEQGQKKVANSSFDSVEVFVSISYHDNGTFESVKSAITSLSGVNYLAYCSDHAVFMVYMDANVYASKDVFMEQVVKLLPQYSSVLHFKNGNFVDLANNCNTLEEAEAAALKNKFGN